MSLTILKEKLRVTLYLAAPSDTDGIHRLKKKWQEPDNIQWVTCRTGVNPTPARN